MYQDIVNTFCITTGYNPNDQADVIRQYINRAAKFIYNSLEADSMLEEVVLIVPRDQQVTLPPYIGGLRGMREYNWAGTIPLYEIGVPRFSSDTWKFKWRNWTYKGKRPLANSITNAGPLTLTTTAVETPNVAVTISGRTSASHFANETRTLSVTSLSTVNSYLDINRNGIAVLANPSYPRQYDITISDVNGNMLAVLYNNEFTTEYILVDVSAYPWMALQGDGTNSYIEVLYKRKFYKFYYPTDTFLVDGYDEAIAYRALELWYEGKPDGSGLQNMQQYAAMRKQEVDENVSNDEVGQSRRIANGSNPTYQVFRKLRNSWGWRRFPGHYWYR